MDECGQVLTDVTVMGFGRGIEESCWWPELHIGLRRRRVCGSLGGDAGRLLDRAVG